MDFSHTPLLKVMLNNKCFLVPITRIFVALLLVCSSAVHGQESTAQLRLPAAKYAKVQKIESHTKNKTGRKMTDIFQTGDEKVRVIVKTKKLIPKTASSKTPEGRKAIHEVATQALEKVTDRFEERDVKIKSKLAFIDGFSAEVSLDGLEQLVSEEDVIAVYEDRKRRPMLRDGISLMKGVPARNLSGGAGVSIAILDTGIDYNHPDLGNGGFPNSKVIGGYDTGEDDSDPMDTYGHGTAVAGIAAGDIPVSEVGAYIGGLHLPPSYMH